MEFILHGMQGLYQHALDLVIVKRVSLEVIIALKCIKNILGSRKRQRTSTQGEDLGLHLTQQDELEVLSQASSSGYSRPSRRSSSQSSRSRTRYIYSNIFIIYY